MPVLILGVDLPRPVPPHVPLGRALQGGDAVSGDGPDEQPGLRAHPPQEAQGAARPLPGAERARGRGPRRGLPAPALRVLGPRGGRGGGGGLRHGRRERRGDSRGRRRRRAGRGAGERLAPQGRAAARARRGALRAGRGPGRAGRGGRAGALRQERRGGARAGLPGALPRAAPVADRHVPGLHVPAVAAGRLLAVRGLHPVFDRDDGGGDGAPAASDASRGAFRAPLRPPRRRAAPPPARAQVMQRRKTLQSLSGMSARAAPVLCLRDGQWQDVSSDELLPGDLISIARRRRARRRSPPSRRRRRPRARRRRGSGRTRGGSSRRSATPTSARSRRSSPATACSSRAPR